MDSFEQREQRLWDHIHRERAAYGAPQAICSAITPFRFWVVVASVVVFLPLALIAAFFIKRHAILVQAGEIVVLDLSFWRYRVEGERVSAPLGAGAVQRDGNVLVVEGQRFHLEPGWGQSADRIIELDQGAR